MNRGTVLAGMVATAAGLLVPEAGLATPARRFWALDRTMVAPNRVFGLTVPELLERLDYDLRAEARYLQHAGRADAIIAYMHPKVLAAVSQHLPEHPLIRGALDAQTGLLRDALVTARWELHPNAMWQVMPAGGLGEDPRLYVKRFLPYVA